MPQQYIHVKIGLTDGIYPVREFITTGLMHDMYEFQQDEHTKSIRRRSLANTEGSPMEVKKVVQGPTH